MKIKNFFKYYNNYLIIEENVILKDIYLIK